MMSYYLELHPESEVSEALRLNYGKDIFASVARSEVTESSYIDIYLEFTKSYLQQNNLKLKVELLRPFGETKVDVVSRTNTIKGQRLLLQIGRGGVRVFSGARSQNFRGNEGKTKNRMVFTCGDEK